MLRFLAILSPAKAKGPVKTAVLNRDDSSYTYLHEITAARQVTYGLTQEAAVIAQDVLGDAEGLRFTVRGPGYEAPCHSPLIGVYNVANCLAAFTAAVEGLRLPLSAAIEGIAALQSVPGRMERLDLGQPFHAIVDFAHTPNALRRALEAPVPELAAEDLRLATRALGRITGKVGVEDLLDVIFRDFCIGK